MLSCFKDLGYNVEWRVINAADYGFSQRRRRVFIFAYRNDTNYCRRVTQFMEDDGFMEAYIREVGLFTQEFPIETIYAENRVTLDMPIFEISNEFSFRFQEFGVMIGNEIYTARYTPVEMRATTLGEILQQDVSGEFYIGEELDR